MVRRLLDIRIVRHQRPDIVLQLAPVAAEENIAARLAIKQLEHPRTALASWDRPVEKAAYRNACVIPAGFSARWVAAGPDTLHVSEEQVRPDRHDG